MVGGADKSKTIHPLFIRVTHWVNAFAIFVMVLSGWRIYNVSPLFGFEFPKDFTLGGWLAGALAWHFAAMWLLALNGFAYFAYGFVSGHFRRRFLPVSLRGAFEDVLLAMRGVLTHAPGRYQRRSAAVLHRGRPRRDRRHPVRTRHMEGCAVE